MNPNTHFIIAVAGTMGDVFPFIELGKCLQQRNHKVSFITNPYLGGAVKSAGLAFVPFGTVEQAMAALNDPAMWNARNGFNVFWSKMIDPNLHSIRLYVKSLNPRENVVIFAHPALLALANLARADRDNLKIVMFCLYPAILRSLFGKLALGPFVLRERPRLLRKLIYLMLDNMVLDRGIVPSLNRERVKIGLGTIAHFFPHLQESADLYVTLFPEWYSSTKADYPKPLISGDFVHYGSLTGEMSEELKGFLDSGPPPILFTPGSGNRHAGKFFAMAVDVVKELKTRAVFITKFREQVPVNLPGSILWQEYVPFGNLLPSLGIIVHHGGTGTAAAAAKVGLPQLIIPFAYEQFDTALIVKALGIGRSIPLQLLTKNRLLSQLLMLRESEPIAKNCRRISIRMKSGLSTSQLMDKVLSVVLDVDRPQSEMHGYRLPTSRIVSEAFSWGGE